MCDGPSYLELHSLGTEENLQADDPKWSSGALTKRVRTLLGDDRHIAGRGGVRGIYIY